MPPRGGPARIPQPNKEGRSMMRWFPMACVLAAALVPVRGHAAGQGGGMPQLDFGNTLVVAQVVWMLLIFAALYWLVKERGLPLVAEVLEERRRRIEADLEAAQASKAEADAALAAHRDATLKARAEAQNAINAALHAAQSAAEADAQVLNARLAAQIRTAEERIDASRSAAMGALREVATDTAEALVTRLVGQADRAALGRAVERELAARGRA
jgi:F-type H+-transporting ATPase subunit b